MGILETIVSLISLETLASVAWAYLFTDFVIEKILKKVRGPGRPTRRFNFIILIISLFIAQKFSEWIESIIANVPVWIYAILLILAFFAAKDRGLI